MRSFQKKLSKENQDLINSMTSIELFNYLDSRRDLFIKKFIASPSMKIKIQKLSKISTLLILIGIIVAVFSELYIISYSLYAAGLILFLVTSLKYRKFFNKKNDKLDRIMYEKGLSFYLSKEYDDVI